MPPYLTLFLILWDGSYKMAHYGTNQEHKQFCLPHCLHPPFHPAVPQPPVTPPFSLIASHVSPSFLPT